MAAARTLTTRRSLAQHQEWARAGTELFLSAVDGLGDRALAGPSLLPDWSRKHLLAHISANAEALGRLADWASSGVPSPMYSSPRQRAADIESGAELDVQVLRTWAITSAEALERKLEVLSDAAWRREVQTAQGRLVPASEVPWMRAREVMVHAVDLGTGLGFADLPHDFLTALALDAAAKRSGGEGPALVLTISESGEQVHVTGQGEPRKVTGGLASLVAWLVGRPTGRVRTSDGSPVPVLAPWL